MLKQHAKAHLITIGKRYLDRPATPNGETFDRSTGRNVICVVSFWTLAQKRKKPPID